MGGKILSKDRRFVYLVRWYASGATTARLDTVTLTASGAPWAIEATQTGVEWLFSADTTLTTRPSQTVGAIENKTELQQAGAELGHVVRTRIFVTNMAAWPEVGRAHGEVFGQIRPASTLVQVAALIDPRLLVEIEATAIITP